MPPLSRSRSTAGTGWWPGSIFMGAVGLWECSRPPSDREPPPTPTYTIWPPCRTQSPSTPRAILYVADINRGRVLVYWNPFDNSPLPTEPGLPEAPDLLTPQYAGTILSIHPAPPYCVVPEGRDYEALLTLVVDGVDIPRVSGDDESGHSLEFRVIGTHISRSTLIGHAKVETERGGDSKTTIEFIDRRFWRELLAGPDPVAVTVRMINTEGVPLTGWSHSFSLAPSIAACGVALPAPTPVPPSTPTPVPPSTPTPIPTQAATPPAAVRCSSPSNFHIRPTDYSISHP